MTWRNQVEDYTEQIELKKEDIRTEKRGALLCIDFSGT